MKKYYNPRECSLSVGNILIHTVSRDKDYKYNYLSGRPKNAFVHIVCGGISYSFKTLGERDIVALAGDTIFFPCGTRHTSRYLEDGTIIKIVEFDTFTGNLPEYLSSPTKLTAMNISEIINSFFISATTKSENHPFFCLSKLYELLWYIDYQREHFPTKYKRLQPAIDDINGKYFENKKISYYAEICSMSETGFRKMFREFTGTSPIEYRNDIRLTEARKLLQSGEYNVSEVAEAMGFSNLSFFARSYKKKYGYTPKDE